MEPGSLVECINNIKYPDKVQLNTAYTCRAIVLKGDILPFFPECLKATASIDGIYLEEVDGRMPIVVSGFPFLVDLPYPLADFRELMPNLSEAVEEALGLELVEI